LQSPKDNRVAVEVRQLPLALQRVTESLQVPAGLAEVGWLHFDVMQADARIERYLAVLRLLANDLTMHLTLRRNIDDEVAPHQGLAAQAVVLGQRLPSLAKAHLDITDRRKMFRARVDRMLGEFADRADHAAAATQSAAAAYRVDIDADTPGCIEQCRTVREGTATS
jgi:hypothetical protein